MASPSQESIETYMTITGASEAVALQKLEEQGWDLNEAINAHFSEGDNANIHQVSAPVHDNPMDIDDPLENDPLRTSFRILPEVREANPFSLLDSNIHRSFFGGAFGANFPSTSPLVTQPREVRQIPIDVKDDNIEVDSSGRGPRIENITGSESTFGPEVHGTVTLDDNDDIVDLNYFPDARGANASSGASFDTRPGPSAQVHAVDEYSNDIEEEMIKAAIAASKRESGQLDFNGHQMESASEDTDFAHAVSLSLKTAEQEKALREEGVCTGDNESYTLSVAEGGAGSSAATNGRQGSVSNVTESSRQIKSEGQNAYIVEEIEDIEEQPLVRQRSRRISPGNSGSTELAQASGSSPSSPARNINSQPQYIGHGFSSEEWGGMSSMEHDEAIMLEAAMFGGIPEGSAYRFGYPNHQVIDPVLHESTSQFPRIRLPISPTLVEQRLLKEQQDDEYLAALQVDREKELKAKQEAELRHLEEVKKQKHEEEENCRKQIEKEEFEKQLSAKQASLPQEPSPENENSVTLLVRMPDGSRHGRRFLKSDKLRFLFYYIDIGRVVNPGSYRLVRPYPRRAFTEEEGELSLSELGLANKQEALFLELI